MSSLQQIQDCFLAWQGQKAQNIEPLNAASGSNRQYFQIYHGEQTYIGTFNLDTKENEAFFYYNVFFREKGIRVPELYYVDAQRQCYIQQDIGQTPLMQLLKSQGESDTVLSYYKQSLDMLWRMQSQIDDINFSVSYPRPVFDMRSVLWDLNYFKYYFLKLRDIAFDENDLEDEFWSLAQTIAHLPSNKYFLCSAIFRRAISIFIKARCGL